MAKISMFRIFVIYTICSISLVDSVLQEGLSKFLGTLANVKHVRTPELLNQLCNESQGTDVMRRDACYGCFFRASNQPAGYPILLAMSTCADTYLNNTDYGHCQAYLKNATNMLNARVSPTTIYCTFLECIRQVNKDTLDALRIGSRLGPLVHMSERESSKKNPSIIFMKIFPQARRGICVAREVNTDANTVRPGAEPIDPRKPLTADMTHANDNDSMI